MTSRYDVHPMEQAFRDWDAKDKQFQRELNIHVCRKWDELITEGKHGHYETLLSVCRSAIKFWRSRAETESQASADTIREGIKARQELPRLMAEREQLVAALQRSQAALRANDLGNVEAAKEARALLRQIEGAK